MMFHIHIHIYITRGIPVDKITWLKMVILEMIARWFTTEIENATDWTPVFAYRPIAIVSLSENKTATIRWYWLILVERRLVYSKMVGIYHWEYRPMQNRSGNGST